MGEGVSEWERQTSTSTSSANEQCQIVDPSWLLDTHQFTGVYAPDATDSSKHTAATDLCGTLEGMRR